MDRTRHGPNFGMDLETSKRMASGTPRATVPYNNQSKHFAPSACLGVHSPADRSSMAAAAASPRQLTTTTVQGQLQRSSDGSGRHRQGAANTGLAQQRSNPAVPPWAVDRPSEAPLSSATHHSPARRLDSEVRPVRSFYTDSSMDRPSEGTPPERTHQRPAGRTSSDITMGTWYFHDPTARQQQQYREPLRDPAWDRVGSPADAGPPPPYFQF